MARARSLKPGLFKNEILGVADPIYTLAFEGLWTLADREGRLEDRSLRIKAEIFPYREVRIESILDWLSSNGFIIRYKDGINRYIQVVNFSKHQNPHKNEQSSTIPVYSDSLTVVLPNTEQVPNFPVALGLTPSSLTPDSLFIDSLSKPSDIPTGYQPGEDVLPAKQKTPVVTTSTTRAREAKTVPETREAWTAYATAYHARYGVEPVRNAKVSGQFSNLLKRLGKDEAPFVAAYYVKHNSTIYVRSKHAVDLLLRDCEGIRTEWASGRMVTDTQARQTDRKQSNLSVAEQLIAEIRSKQNPGVINDK